MTMGHLFDHGVFKDFEVLEVRMGEHLWIAQTGHALIEGPPVRTWELRVRDVASKVRERQRRKLSATATWPQGRKRDGMRPTVGRGRPARRPPRRAQTQGCEGVAVCRAAGSPPRHGDERWTARGFRRARAASPRGRVWVCEGAARQERSELSAG